MPKENELKSRAWVVNLADPYLSDKFFKFEAIKTKSETEIQREIVVMYGGEQPIYFSYIDEGEKIEGEQELTEEEKKLPEEWQKKIREYYRTKARLDKLTNDPLFRKQIERCIELLQGWIADNLPAWISDPEARKNKQLNVFENNLLRGDHFEGHRAVLYDQGKKSLERITVLARDESINIKYRKGEITGLINNDRLEVCGEGCSTYLSNAADNLQSIVDFSVDGLWRDFLRKQVQKIAIDPIARGKELGIPVEGEDIFVDRLFKLLLSDCIAIARKVKQRINLKAKSSVEAALQKILDNIEAKPESERDDLYSAALRLIHSGDQRVIEVAVKRVRSVIRSPQTREAIKTAIRRQSEKEFKEVIAAIFGKAFREAVQLGIDAIMEDKNTVGDGSENFSEMLQRSMKSEFDFAMEQGIADVLRGRIVGNEVHGLNYLKNKLADYFGFKFLSVVDTYAAEYDSQLSQQATLDPRARKAILNEAYQLFKNRLTANGFVEYITGRLRARFRPYTGDTFLDELKTALDALGPGEEFYPHALLAVNADTGMTTPTTELKMTVTERLVNSEYLKIDTGPESRLSDSSSSFARRNPEVGSDDSQFLESLPSKLVSDQYKIYLSNIGLTWVKRVNPEVDQTRFLFLDVLKQEGSVERLKGIMPLEELSTLNLLIQSPNDLTQCLDATDDVSWLSPLFSTPLDDHSVLSRILSTGETRLSPRLTNFLAYFNTNKDRPGVKRIIDTYPLFIKEMLLQSTQRIKDTGGLLFGKDRFFENLYKLGFNDFNGLIFEYDADEKQFKTTVNLESSIFKMPLSHCKFILVDLSRAKFSGVLEEVDFSGAQLIDTDFSEAKITNHRFDFSKAVSKNKINDQLGGLKFNGASVSTKSFAQILKLYTNLNKDLINLELFSVDEQRSHFKPDNNENTVSLKEIEFPHLDLRGVDFADPGLCEVLNRFETIKLSGCRLTNKVIDFSNFPDLSIQITYGDLQGGTFQGITRQNKLRLFYSNLDKARFRRCDLSQVFFTESSIKTTMKLEDVQLDINQFIQFYRSDYRDFRGVALVGELNPENEGQLSLKGSLLSEEAARYFFEKGIQDFSEVDLKNTGDLLLDYVAKPGYSFEEAIFPPQHAENIKKQLQEKELASKRIELNACESSGLGNRKKREAGLRCIDSKDEEESNKREKVELIKNLAESGKLQFLAQEIISAKATTWDPRSLELYEGIVKIRNKRLLGENIEPDIRQLLDKIDGTDLTTIEPGLRDILAEIKTKSGDGDSIESLLISRQGALNGLGKGLSWTLRTQMIASVIGNLEDGDIKGAAVGIGVLALDPLLGRVLGVTPIGWYLMAVGLANDIKRLSQGDVSGQIIVKTSLDIGIMALSVAALANPELGPVVEALILGEMIWLAVERVDAENKLIHLRPLEKLSEGWRTFIGRKPESYLQELIQQQQADQILVKEADEFLQKHPEISVYVMPTGKLHTYEVDGSGRSVCGWDNIPNEYRKPKGEGCFEGNRQGSICCWVYDKKSEILLDENSTVDLSEKKNRVMWSRAKPDVSAMSADLFCTPSCASDVSYRDRRGIRVSKGSSHLVAAVKGIREKCEIAPEPSYICVAAMALSSASNRTGNTVLFRLGNGTDNAKGVLDQPNVFLVESGEKQFTGGDRWDEFYLLPKNDTDRLSGILNGAGGENILELAALSNHTATDMAIQEERGAIRLVSLVANIQLTLENISIIHARKDAQDEIYCSNAIQYVDGRGGESAAKPDVIRIPAHRQNNLGIVLRPNTVIHNGDKTGQVDYLIPSGNLTLVWNGSRNLIYRINREALFGRVYFNPGEPPSCQFAYELSQLLRIDVNAVLKELSLVFHDGNNDAVVKIHGQTESVKYKLKNTVITVSINENKYSIDIQHVSKQHFSSLEAIIQEYKPLAKRYQATLTLAAMNSVVRIRKSGYVDAIVKPGNGNDYPELPYWALIDKITEKYLTIANRLNASITLQFNTKSIVIGHGSHEILYNDPTRDSELIGQGGENVYSIRPPKSKGFFHGITIDDSANDNAAKENIVSLDLRQVDAKEKGGFKFSSWSAHQEDRDLLLLLELTAGDSPYSMEQYINIRIKGGMDYYQQRLHIYLDAPIPYKLVNNKVEGSPSWGLEAIPSLQNFTMIATEAFRVYPIPRDQGLVIYHNQPNNTYQIGVIDARDRYLSDCNMKLAQGSLVLCDQENRTLVEIKNWDAVPEARDVVFRFNGSVIANRECLSNASCDLNSIKEFHQVQQTSVISGVVKDPKEVFAQHQMGSEGHGESDIKTSYTEQDTVAQDGGISSYLGAGVAALGVLFTGYLGYCLRRRWIGQRGPIVVAGATAIILEGLTGVKTQEIRRGTGWEDREDSEKEDGIIIDMKCADDYDDKPCGLPFEKPENSGHDANKTAKAIPGIPQEENARPTWGNSLFTHHWPRVDGNGLLELAVWAQGWLRKKSNPVLTLKERKENRLSNALTLIDVGALAAEFEKRIKSCAPRAEIDYSAIEWEEKNYHDLRSELRRVMAEAWRVEKISSILTNAIPALKAKGLSDDQKERFYTEAKKEIEYLLDKATELIVSGKSLTFLDETSFQKMSKRDRKVSGKNAANDRELISAQGEAVQAESGMRAGMTFFGGNQSVVTSLQASAYSCEIAGFLR